MPTHQKPLRIIVITPSHNERDLLPAFVAHYQRMGADIHIFDNHSTDGSDQMARDLGCKVDYYGKPDTYETAQTTPVQNEAWRAYRSSHDLVLMVDIDEFIVPIAPFSLDQPAIVRTKGYNVYADGLPTSAPIVEQSVFWSGEPRESYSKPCILNLHKLVEVEFDAGIHKLISARPRYRQRPPLPGAPLLLHLRHIGSDDWALARYKERSQRVRQGTDVERGHSAHYLWDDERFLARRQEVREIAKPIPKPQDIMDSLTPEQMEWPQEKKKWWLFGQ